MTEGINYVTERFAPTSEQAPQENAEEASTAAKLPVVSASTFAGTPVPPRRWIVPGMIPDRTVTAVSGDGGDGKTTLMLQLSLAMAAGRPWLAMDPDPGPVLFLTAEDDVDELHRRCASIAESLSVNLANLSYLHLVPLAGRDAVLGAPLGKMGIVAATSVFRGLISLTERIKPRLIVLDAIADVFGGEENARAQARQFVGLLRGLAIDHGLAVVLIAHPSMTGISSKSGTSGSTAWSNSVRSRLFLERLKDVDGEEPDTNLRRLSIKKANYGPTGRELRIRWQNGAFILDGTAGGFEKIAADAKAERVFLALLEAFERQDRHVSPKPSNTYAPAVFAKHPNSEGVSGRSLELAMERLLVAGRIGVDTTGPPSKRSSKLKIAQAAA